MFNNHSGNCSLLCVHIVIENAMSDYYNKPFVDMFYNRTYFIIYFLFNVSRMKFNNQLFKEI